MSEEALHSGAKKLGVKDSVLSWLKKWAVLYRGRWMHFGAKGYEDYTQHHDPLRRVSYRKRHAGIFLKDGRVPVKHTSDM